MNQAQALYQQALEDDRITADEYSAILMASRDQRAQQPGAAAGPGGQGGGVAAPLIAGGVVGAGKAGAEALFASGAAPAVPEIVSAGVVPTAIPSAGASQGTGLSALANALSAPTNTTPVLGANAALLPGAVAAAGLTSEVVNLIDDPDEWLKGDSSFNGINGASIIRRGIYDLFGGGPHPDRADRMAVRDGISENTDIYQDGRTNEIKLANGSVYDTNNHPTQQSYNIDWGQDGVGDLVGALNPLVQALNQQPDNGKVQQDIVGDFVNAVSSQGDAQANIDTLYANSGLDRNTIYNAVAEQWANNPNAFDANTRDAYFAAIDKQFGVENTSGSRWDDQALTRKDLINRNKQELLSK